MRKAWGDATIRAERPTATSVVWTTIPLIAPNMQAKPAARPSDSARPTKSVMSGPGVIEIMKVAIANSRMVATSGTNDMAGVRRMAPMDNAKALAAPDGGPSQNWHKFVDRLLPHRREPL